MFVVAGVQRERDGHPRENHRVIKSNEGESCHGINHMHIVDAVNFARLKHTQHDAERTSYPRVALIRRTPAEDASSFSILKTPISPVRVTCGPPQTSVLK